MRTKKIRTFHIARRCVVAVLCLFGSIETATAQLTDGSIVITEFFEEIYQINPGGATSDLLDSAITEGIGGGNLVIANASTAYTTYLGELSRFDFASGQLTTIDNLSFSPSEITLDIDGSLIATGNSQLTRIDPATGDEEFLYDEDFWSPSDAVVDDAGNIYVTEFFDAVGVIPAGGTFVQIGDFFPNTFAHLDLGPDGMLYLSTTFGGSFFRVDPSTGAGVELDTAVFSSLGDLQVDTAGDILFTGTVDGITGVHRFDPSTTTVTTILDGSTLNGGFFSPDDIALFVPEPGTLLLLLAATAGSCGTIRTRG